MTMSRIRVGPFMHLANPSPDTSVSPGFPDLWEDWIRSVGGMRRPGENLLNDAIRR